MPVRAARSGEPPLNKTPCRILVSGCGAVTQMYYADALASLSRSGRIALIAVFDPSRPAAEAMALRFPGAAIVAAFDELMLHNADVAIIASPPGFHASQALAALQQGLHVFCEKPLATSAADSRRLIDGSVAHRRLAAVGLVRRQFPATRAIHKLLHANAIGAVHSIFCFEGGPFVWPVSSQSYFSLTQSGGGVLQDIGTHCIDLLSWWLGPPRLDSYEDDAMGGVEANCRVRLRFGRAAADIRLSREWAQPNRYRILGESGRITWCVDDPARFQLSLGSEGEERLELQCAAQGEGSFEECFTAQLRNFVQSVTVGDPPAVPLQAGHDVLEIVEQCYRSRKLLPAAWLMPPEMSEVPCSTSK